MVASINASTSAGVVTTADTSGILQLQTASTAALTIDASQNVGIGTASPTALTSNKALTINSPTGFGSLLDLKTNETLNLRVFSNASSSGLSLKTATPLVFETNDTERMRIDSSGNLLVGTTSALSAGTKLTVSGSNADWMAGVANTNASPRGLFINHSTDSNGTANWFLYCEAGGSTQRMSVRSNGGIANYSANNVNLSDRREKNNFAPAKAYLDIVCNIPVQTFNYIDQNLEEDAGLTLGVVAQDVQAVAPELVMESNWGTEQEPKMRLSIYQTDLQYALMKSIQELKAMVDSIQSEFDAYKATHP